MIENKNNSVENGEQVQRQTDIENESKIVGKTLIPCKECEDRIFKIAITEDLLEDVEKYPFTIVTMHAAHDGTKKVHTVVAYIDKQLQCRHAEVLTGKRVFITPYILYNPNLLFLSCVKNIGSF